MIPPRGYTGSVDACEPSRRSDELCTSPVWGSDGLSGSSLNCQAPRVQANVRTNGMISSGSCQHPNTDVSAPAVLLSREVQKHTTSWVAKLLRREPRWTHEYERARRARRTGQIYLLCGQDGPTHIRARAFRCTRLGSSSGLCAGAFRGGDTLPRYCVERLDAVHYK